MHLQLTEEERAFQQEVRTFMRDNVPASIKEKVERGVSLSREDHVTWQKILHKQGWMAPGWPVEHGGTGWSPVQKHIFEEEMAMASTPRIVPFGVAMVAPVIMKFGSEEQKQRFLPRILATDDWWCQGYSEPGSGSDLASLSTKAERDGDYYVVNGQKTWTTMAQHADWIFCLVRTSREDKKQEGISFLLIDMKTPGVSVHPIKTMDGSAEINQTHFENVRVPVENRIGEEGKGWTYAKYLLGHERTGIASVGRSKWQLARLKNVAREEQENGRPLIEDETFAMQIAEVEADLQALEAVVLKIVSQEEAGQGPGPEASILKINGTLIQQKLTELLYKAVGNYAHPFIAEAFDEGWNEDRVGPDYAAPFAPVYFNWRKASIYGGSNEIQKNIIAKAVLRL
ncbi:MAG: pimeloyl-CoA dehydrogenase large subunit [Gammaproteobacteria bacterium]|nr:pimeloyl-CoA dehydrogenase large subunit [Gammaproteobacteria bacterium]